VWTNDDLSSLQGDSAIPAGGNPKHKPAAKLTQTPAKKKSANPYQGEIAKLQAQLPAINDQIAELQAVLSGNTVNTPRKYVGVKPDSWQIELDQLQTKRADIQSQIDALEDQARHSGVPANTLP
jgi:peptidoglycan hydrolase CwlO-like protein